VNGLLSPLLLATLVPLAACGRSQAKVIDQDTSRPDVLLIVVDTLRPDRLEPYGCERPTSPTIQSLAQRGVVFEDVTAQGSWTKPSMVSFLQGRYLTTYRDIPLEDSPTMAELFRAAGYRTLAVVGNRLLSDREDFDRGFEGFYNSGASEAEHSSQGEDLMQAGRELLAQAYAPEEDGSRPPVFTWFHFMEPHSPYRRHPEFEEELPTDREMLGERRARYREIMGEDAPTKTWMRIARSLAAYDQEVRKADYWIDVLLGEVDRLGDLDNTIVVIASDHGEGLWQQASPPTERPTDLVSPQTVLHGGHGKMVSINLVATPLILSGPGIPEGVRVGEPVTNLDLFPTLLALCAQDVPEVLDGRDLRAAMHGAPLANEAVYTRVQKERAVRDPDSSWRLVVPSEGYEGEREVRLHDVAADPRETSNAAQTHPDILRRLQAVLEGMEAQHASETSLGRVRSKQEQADMAALGYAGDDG
jgi:arylsulfatase A-like enzyme